MKCVKPQGTYLMWLDISDVQERVGAKQKAMEMTKSGGKPVTPVASAAVETQERGGHARAPAREADHRPHAAVSHGFLPFFTV